MNNSARILIVDDDVAIGLLFSDLLKDCGYGVSVVAAGASALRAVGDAHFDVAIVDLGLPDMCGLETIERMRRECPWLFIVAISAWMWNGMADAARDAGASLSLPKPVSLQKLLGVIHVHANPPEVSRFTYAH